MKKSLFLRLFTSYVFVIFALTGLTLVVLWSSIEKHYMSTLKNTLRNSALMARPAILPLFKANRLADLEKTVRALGKETQTRITVVNAQGKVLADSDENPETMENHKGRPEFLEALQGNVGSSKRFSSTAGQDMLYVAIPLEQTNKQVIGAAPNELLSAQYQ